MRRSSARSSRILKGVPVWKGRSFDQYEPHGNEPAGYSDWDEVLTFVQRKRTRSPVFRRMFAREFLADPNTHPINHCRIAFRDVTNRTNSRTVIACLIPPRTPLTNSAPYLVSSGWTAIEQASLLGTMNSLAFDWLSRRYVELHLNFYVLNMLCFPPQDITPWIRIGELAARLSCVDDRFDDFAAEAGVECGLLTDGPVARPAGGDRRAGSPCLRPDRGRTPLHLHRLHRKRRLTVLPRPSPQEVRAPVVEQTLTARQSSLQWGRSVSVRARC